MSETAYQGYTFRVRAAVPTTSMGPVRNTIQIQRPDGTFFPKPFSSQTEAERAVDGELAEIADLPYREMFTRVMKGESVQCPVEGCTHTLTKREQSGLFYGECPDHGNQTKGLRVGA